MVTTSVECFHDVGPEESGPARDQDSTGIFCVHLRLPFLSSLSECLVGDVGIVPLLPTHAGRSLLSYITFHTATRDVGPDKMDTS